MRKITIVVSDAEFKKISRAAQLEGDSESKFLKAWAMPNAESAIGYALRKDELAKNLIVFRKRA